MNFKTKNILIDGKIVAKVFKYKKKKLKEFNFLHLMNIICKLALWPIVKII